MSGFVNLLDVIPCPEKDEHEWMDSRMVGNADSNTPEEPYKAECANCAALIEKMWWGWEFKTGLEHFDDAQHDPKNRALLAEMQAYHRPNANNILDYGIYVDPRLIT